tara:strand:- start:8225 stop:8764 length:540 start_codon:yes stop_codon:yes gene_type:complete
MSLTLSNTNERALAVVTIHGIVDVLSPAKLLLYAAVGLAIGLSPRVQRLLLDHPTRLFFVASWVHFAEDLGWAPSAALHLAVVGLHTRQRTDAATRLMLVYILLVHLPCLFWRLAREGATLSTVLLLGALLTAARTPSLVNDLVHSFGPDRATFTLGGWHQAVVICHVVGHELSRPRSS